LEELGGEGTRRLPLSPHKNNKHKKERRQTPVLSALKEKALVESAGQRPGAGRWNLRKRLLSLQINHSSFGVFHWFVRLSMLILKGSSPTLASCPVSRASSLIKRSLSALSSRVSERFLFDLLRNSNREIFHKLCLRPGRAAYYYRALIN
jgi:hypothetical protein